MIVYLAGGMKTEWRDSIIAAFPDWTFLDPSRHGLDDEREYTAWDLDGVRKSDIVFGYMEITNPSGIGLSVEFGYGHALRKRLIFVEPTDLPIARRFGMVRAMAEVVLPSIEDGIEYLRRAAPLTRGVVGDLAVAPPEAAGSYNTALRERLVWLFPLLSIVDYERVFREVETWHAATDLVTGLNDTNDLVLRLRNRIEQEAKRAAHFNEKFQRQCDRTDEELARALRAEFDLRDAKATIEQLQRERDEARKESVWQRRRADGSDDQLVYLSGWCERVTGVRNNEVIGRDEWPHRLCEVIEKAIYATIERQHKQIADAEAVFIRCRSFIDAKAFTAAGDSLIEMIDAWRTEMRK